ncbi:phosphonate C-P lyase system protein PhnG [Alicyclobacillus fastidiosus]|uniref:Phosphonate C-P lyase system protein PhnG n=1 Tax=Alicyclobacillus fastidiosus TaxID=392011 RepID=A0ABV5AJX2_9BACL|nr:phosphonate C-P lyase system protein PhnG [Alicyclobacillus fastidiosus]WEH09036.1 phosphonate C-P lyase system protein PhnG [Alicyclobacillus fastidiosus]
MDTNRRTKILSESSLRDLEPWIAKVEWMADIQVVKPPQMGLVMMRARESVEQEVFNVGEVLVSECTVTVDGQLGFGIVAEHDLERARALAVLDAVFHANSPKWEGLQKELDAWLGAQEVQQEEAWRRDFANIQRSLVNFDLLEEVDND